jgi:rRNA maturation RNase YbeY
LRYTVRMSLTISRTAAAYPTHPYAEMKDAILGKSYVLSLAFVGETRAQKLNVAYRNKTYVPNVLSFPLAKNAGEIYITPKVAAREAKKFNMTPRGYIGYLFIHGLLHLKGYPHGDTMDKAERKYVARFGLRS